MNSNSRRPLFAVALALTLALVFAPVAAMAQGVQTATLAGTVNSSDGQPLPGATVSITSSSLQGERTAVSDANGNYLFRGLPTGTYKVAFALSGFATVERSVVLQLGDAPTINATMSVQSVEETITVTATAPSVLNTSTVGATYKGESVDKLAMGRTLAAIAELAPGLTDATPNAGQVTIQGAMAFDNVFLLNGVDINDNLFGTANNLFIEDAIEETQVLTSGISAEYGRFSGGVINAITKRGGNSFSGSFRTDFTNSAWTDETPFQKERGQEQTSKLNKVYQGTLGGPIIKDKLWFFGATRITPVATTSQTFASTGIPYETLLKNRRYEGKLTGSINPNHTVTVNYAKNSTDQTQPSFGFSIDPRTIISRSLPNDLLVANYNGVLSANLFFEAQYSQKKFGFRDSGSSFTDIKDSPMLALGQTSVAAVSHYNAPYFDNSDPENRDNKQITAALSYFLSTADLGRHDLKLGFENYTSTRTGGNSQSSTGYVFDVDPVVSGGTVVLQNGRLIPRFVSGASLLERWDPVRNAEVNITTRSLYLNDRWTLNENWSFNLGARYEKIDSEATQVQEGADTSALVPRLGATWDIKGDGKHRIYATYAHYAGKGSETQLAENSNVGTPNYRLYVYTGPTGQGLDFAPGFDVNNYELIDGSFPTANVFLGDGLGTPRTKEWTLQYGARLGNKGEFKVSFTNRTMGDLVEDFIDDPSAAGKTTVIVDGVNFGTFDNVVMRNSDFAERKYQGLQFEMNYRLTDNWTIAGHYTNQLKNEGNYEGEGANTPGSPSIIGDRPEIYSEARHFPYGKTNDYQQHKARAWTTYNLDLGKGGDLSLSALWRFNSGLAYSLAAAGGGATSIQRALNPGYASMPGAQTIFFGGRGSEEFASLHLFDFAMNYEVKVWRTFRPWFKAEVRNVLNNDKLATWNTTITAVRTAGAPVDNLGLATTYVKGANFGKATGNANYATPRTFQASVGFRF
ncbi:MAG: TonB-dependent receptor [Vicinamibacteria bacterium]|nr:TonB-dependent receptor [Vicinamibacteria bacterium]